MLKCSIRLLTFRSVKQSGTLLWIATLMLVCGCESPTEWPGTTTQAARKVNVTVQLDGSPVEDARVMLIPETFQQSTGAMVPIAYGTTNADGNCQLADTEGGTNLAPVKYRCLVSKPNSAYGFSAVSSIKPESDLGLLFDPKDDQIPSVYHRYSELFVDLAARTDDPVELELDLSSEGKR